MARLPALPKVTFYWTVETTGLKETKAMCRLCRSPFWGYSRNDVYPSTSNHKRSCPVLVEAMSERRKAENARLQADLAVLEAQDQVH